MGLAIIIWIFCGIAASFVAQARGASGCLWFGLGGLFGPFGLAFAFLAGTDAKCHACRKHIHPQATKCPFCQSAVGAAVVATVATHAAMCECGATFTGANTFCGDCGRPRRTLTP
jgi:hypothetical protein